MIFIRSLAYKIQQIMQHSGTPYFFLLFALFLKIALLQHFFLFDGDRMFQALATKSWVQGNGITLPMVNTQNLSHVNYTPLVAWPAGYSILLSPIYILTKDLKLSCFILDVLGAACFLFVYLQLLKKLAVPNWSISLLLLFNSLTFSQDLLYSAPTDLLSVTLLLLAVYFSEVLFQKNSPSILSGYVLGLLCFLPAFFRHLYLPIVAVLPLILLLYGKLHRNKRQVIIALIALSVITILSAYQVEGLLSPNAYRGNLAAPDGTSFHAYFQPLKDLHAFLFSAFININFLSQQLSLVTGLTYNTITKTLVIIHCFIAIAVVSFAVRFVVTKWRKLQTTWDFFLFATIVICLLILVELVFLSSVSPPINGWTYIQEERYYKFIAICLPIVAIKYLFNNRQLQLALRNQLARAGLVVIISAGILHGLYFIVKRTHPLQQLHRSGLYENERCLKIFIDSCKKTGIDIVVGSTNSYYYGHASYFDAKAIYRCYDINGPLYTEKPTVLLAILDEQYLKHYKPFLAKPGVKLELTQNKTYFYSLLVPAMALSRISL